MELFCHDIICSLSNCLELSHVRIQEPIYLIDLLYSKMHFLSLNSHHWVYVRDYAKVSIKIMHPLLIIIVAVRGKAHLPTSGESSIKSQEFLLFFI